jgi:hypothetical protein
MENKPASKKRKDARINTASNQDLKLILDEADKITLTDLEFDKIFKEQTKILCDIKTILEEEKHKQISPNSIGKSMGKCNIAALHNDSKFKTLLSNYKKKYSSITRISAPKSMHHDSKHTMKGTRKSVHHSRGSKNKSTKPARIINKQSSKSNSKDNSKDNSRLDNNYPIVLLKGKGKGKKVYKNVITY